MFIKKSQVKVESIEVLNKPDFSHSNFSFLKVADLQITELPKEADSKQADTNKDGNNAKFNLEAEVKDHPDSLYVKCFAIKANETNDNGDWFSTEELKKATHTFVGVPVFTNHQNNDVEKARGQVVHAWYDDEKDGIMVIKRIDAVAYPHLARGIKEGYMASTSMGTQVQYSLCSICHNFSSKPDQYCNHIKEQKNKKLSGTFECIYKKHGNEDKCPLCGCGKNEEKLNKIANIDVHEKNYDLKFIEDSFVVNPACHECGVTEVIDTSIFLKKVAELNCRLPGLIKAASVYTVACAEEGNCISLIGEEEARVFESALEQINNFAGKIAVVDKENEVVTKILGLNLNPFRKYAGEQELKDLKQALGLIADVAKKMIDQRAQVDLEFLNELTECLSQLQSTAAELEQMGYGRLPSSPDTPSPELSPTGQAPATPGSPTGAPPGSPSTVQTGNAGQAGTFTSPVSAKNKRCVIKMGTSRKERKINIPFNIESKNTRKAQ